MKNSPFVSFETIPLFHKWGQQVFRFFVSFATVNFYCVVGTLGGARKLFSQSFPAIDQIIIQFGTINNINRKISSERAKVMAANC